MSLQVFVDQEGQRISFNKGGCLIMNLRHFEACRTSLAFYSSPTANLSLSLLDDCDVQRGDFNKALIFWSVFPVFLC